MVSGRRIALRGHAKNFEEYDRQTFVKPSSKHFFQADKFLSTQNRLNNTSGPSVGENLQHLCPILPQTRPVISEWSLFTKEFKMY